ncbi:MAG TPA: hypothetical protein VIY08_12860, partial [Candidatus Nitrosocosmicus sp.]
MLIKSIIASDPLSIFPVGKMRWNDSYFLDGGIDFKRPFESASKIDTKSILLYRSRVSTNFLNLVQGPQSISYAIRYFCIHTHNNFYQTRVK